MSVGVTPASTGGVAAGGGAGTGGLRTLARGGAVNLVGAGASAVVNLLLVTVITRNYSKSVAGTFFATTSLFLVLAALGRLGSGTGVVYFVSRFRALGEHRLVPQVLRIALRPVVVASVASGVFLVLAAPEVADAVSKTRSTGLATDYLRVLGVFLPFAAASEVFQAATRGFGNMKATNVIEKIARPLAQLVLMLLAAALAPAAIMLAWAFPYLPAAMASYVWLGVLRRRAAARSDKAATSRPDAEGRASVTITHASYWRFSGPRALSSLAQVIVQRLDVVLLSRLVSDAVSGIYGAATRFLVVGQLGAQAISQAIQPQISAVLARKDKRAANTLYQTSTAWLVAVAWPIYLLSAVFATAILSVFGRGYDVGRPVIVLLALTMLVATGCGLVDVMLTMAGRSTWTLANTLLGLLVNLTLNLVLIPRYGMVGAAWAWTASILTTNLVPLTQVALTLRLHPFGRGTWLAAGLAGTCFGILPSAVRLFAPGRPELVVAAALAGAVLYAGGLWRGRGLLHLDELLGALPGPGRALARRLRG